MFLASKNILIRLFRKYYIFYMIQKNENKDNISKSKKKLKTKKMKI